MELGLNSAEKKLVIDIHLKKLHNKITLASLFKFLNTILQHKAQRTKTMRQLLPFIATFVVYLRKFRAQQFKIFTKVSARKHLWSRSFCCLLEAVCPPVNPCRLNRTGTAIFICWIFSKTGSLTTGTEPSPATPPAWWRMAAISSSRTGSGTGGWPGWSMSPTRINRPLADSLRKQTSKSGSGARPASSMMIYRNWISSVGGFLNFSRQWHFRQIAVFVFFFLETKMLPAQKQKNTGHHDPDIKCDTATGVFLFRLQNVVDVSLFIQSNLFALQCFLLSIILY